MSAKARGIILSGDLGKLVVEASDAEVARFAAHDLVEIGLLDRPRPPSFAGMYFYGGGSALDAWAHLSPVVSDNAILRTRCGCTRTINVDPGRPPNVFNIAIHDPALLPVVIPEATQIMSMVRSFARRRSRVQDNGMIVHEYEEELR